MIHPQEARRMILAAQGLWGEPAFGKGLAGARNALGHLGYVQIDTISVVERAHHHILWTRVPDYRPAMLDRLVRDRDAFEYWSHAVSYLPIEDFRFSLPRKRLYASGKKHWFEATPDHQKWRRRILSRIRDEGPLSARDFEAPPGHQSSGWFDWKPSKQVLEQLFMEGRLMVAGRKGFQKIYDLTERVLPDDVDTRFPSEAEQGRHMVRRALQAQGIMRQGEIAHIMRKPAHDRAGRALKALLREGEVLEFQIKGLEGSFYALASDFENLRERAAHDVGANSKRVHVLSPFDNLVIRRERLKELFGFDYTIECYVPQEKRRYGYFCLPILKGDGFIGRLDAKAERETKRLLLQSLHTENDFETKRVLPQMKTALQDFARFNGCDHLSMSSSLPASSKAFRSL